MRTLIQLKKLKLLTEYLVIKEVFIYPLEKITDITIKIKVNVLTSYEHNTDGKYFFAVSVWTDVAETHAGETAESEVKSCDVLRFDCGTSSVLIRLMCLPR